MPRNVFEVTQKDIVTSKDVVLVFSVIPLEKDFFLIIRDCCTNFTSHVKRIKANWLTSIPHEIIRNP